MMTKSLFLMAFVTACGAGQEPTDAGLSSALLQMNDVSILFPLPKTESENGVTLAASAVGAKGVLFPKAAFHALGYLDGATEGMTYKSVSMYEDMRVVAVRIDPCFASLAPDASVDCKNQLRLTLQAITKSTFTFVDGYVTPDSAVHLFYQISRAELLSFADGVANLRQASAPGQRLGPLAVHPMMLSEGLNGPMAKGVRELILRFAGTNNLVRVATLTGSNGFIWSFEAKNVAADGGLERSAIATLPPQSFIQTTFSGFFIEKPETSFSPVTQHADNFSALASIETAKELTVTQRETAFAGLVRILNPARHSPETIDCASCHFATITSQAIAAPKFGLVESGHPEAFVADPRFVSGDELAITPSQVFFNVHAFSFTFNQAHINQRTVNETAAVVAYLNALR
jgi:hypothetical protein